MNDAQKIAKALKEGCAFPELLTNVEIQQVIDTFGAKCSVYDVRWYLV